MFTRKHLFKLVLMFLSVALAAGGVCPLYAGEAAGDFKKNKSGYYKDLFDYNVFDEGTSYLHMERLSRAIHGKKLPAADVNVYDEVPDSEFFTNRHARKRLSEKELADGYRETPGPDLSRAVTVKSADVEDQHLVFYAKDAKGDDYQLRFDASDSFELATSAEVIASRFYYAIGYNVPQYTVEIFPSSKLELDPNAYIYDDSGFKGALTKERFQECLTAMPLDPKGNYRVSACKIPAGINEGSFSLREDRRKEDPQDAILHNQRRSLRALRVFASWLNDFDIRESKTMDLFQDAQGRKVLKHYLTGFRSALGSGGDGVKPPEFGYEHLADFGEVTKSLLSLGLRQKTWEKKWDAEGQMLNQSSAVGYFNNTYFDPEKFKTHLPNYAFKDMTRADAYWAAKIIKSFTNEDIRTMVGAGKLSDPKDADYLTTTLLNRRDLIAKYWFSQASSLDNFNLQSGKLTFVDLGVKMALWNPEGQQYSADVCEQDGKKLRKIETLESAGTSLDLQKFLSGNTPLKVFIRTKRPQDAKPGAYVCVEISGNRITGITHED